MKVERPAVLIGLLALLAVAITAAYGPLLMEEAGNLWRRSHYQHFPFVLLASVLLFARGLADPGPDEPPHKAWAWVGGIASWLLLGLASLIPSPLFASASLLLLLGAGGCVLARRADAPFPLASWALAWLVLPPPLGLDHKLIGTLQRSSSWLAGKALDVMGVNHLMDGNALVLIDKTLFVDEACSGIVSAISIVTCAAMYAVWRRRGLAHGLLLMATAAGWSVLINVMRIVSIALAHRWAGADWAEGLPHTMVGIAAFALSLLTLVATDWLLKAALAEVGPRWRQLTGEPLRFGSLLVNAWDRFIATSGRPVEKPAYAGSFSWGWLLTGSVGLGATLVATLAFASLGAAQLVWLTTPERAKLNFPDVGAFAAGLQNGAMPDRLLGMQLIHTEHQQRDRDSIFGANSVIYEYKHGNGDVYLVSCDFPFVGGWHELSVCYRGIGWRLDGREVEVVSAGGEAYEFARLELTRPDGRSALVDFCATGIDGAPIKAPALTLVESLFEAFSRRESYADARQTYQVQVLTERIEEISDADREVAKNLLDEARKRVAAVAESL
ncbi:exosortase U [Botrimarina mediterranea]|uniref:Transmembrane exosortase (Exosortase_EpsH) n=1 Tax=Botrimarina mediterranea TaxID=2528022 RepID=A0A518K5I1_9BACT|nr:exosortase U [Botrimarina mediterranea]QDV73035.1 Transmembrane exosortase (Exosortase_EpsH) [Botrimarina mediterranea]QDV77608.1 Transmembrane exosortase (Exosortase_EpsH) [Planctomycetes bacterium K2D]